MSPARPLRLSPALAICTLLAGPALSAPPPSADELVARNVAAHGGAARVSALKSVRRSGKLTFGGGDFSIEGALVQVVARPGRSRFEMTLQGLTQVEAFDGKEGWTIDPFGGRRDPDRASADAARELAREADLDGPLFRAAEKGNRVELLGTEDVDGTEAWKLRVTRRDGDVQVVYLDPDSSLEIRIVTEHRERGVEHVSETDLGAWEEVGGLWFPFSIESGRKGGPKGTRIALDRVEVDVAAAETLFAFPAPGSTTSRLLSPSPAQPARGPAASAKGSSAAPPQPASSPTAARFDSGVLSGLGARNIGSAAMSGRISSLAARNEGGKTTIFVGAASGGVWKSSDGGTTFKPVFDREKVQSIGAVALDPNDPKTVWVGTGEAWTRNSVSVGDGIYRSRDGGETWKNVGLPESERILRILVHPKDGKVVYACVPGKLWSDSADRGLYKTTDGGESWSLVLAGPSLSTGCASVSMDPKDPEVLFASLWDFRRQGWTFRSGGETPASPSRSGMFRSADGGKSWTELTAAANRGLPAAPWGRVEVEVAPSDAKVVYAVVEAAKESGLYRSSDGGKTWEPRDRSQMMVWRPFYFARLAVDPKNADRLFKAGGGLIVSEDGGRSFSYTGGGSHGDWHDLWIDPDNPKHVVGGDDGGLWISFDGGSRWWKTNNLPVSQFYHVSVDDKDPYRVYGGLQDNGSWRGDSSYPGGITTSRWENVGGGDGFWTYLDPTDPDGVYSESQGGYVSRLDLATRASRDLQPKAGYKEKLRFHWNSPIALSPNDPATIYLGSQFLFRSRDRGQTWERISPDLSTNDPQKQKQEESGGVTVDNSSAEMHTVIYAIAESPKDGKVIWAGTDDGNLQLTRDGGATWTNVTPNVSGLPPASGVSWVEASRTDAATAYAAFDRHTFGDMTPWLYRTTDFGKSWTRLAGPGTGVRGYAHCVKEDTVNRSLLFLGTEFGLWVSIDGGEGWAEFKGGDFPAVAVREIVVHPRDGDLVLATHGRGIWIVDDLSPLRALSAPLLAADAAFLPGRPVQQRMPASGGWVEGDAAFVGANPSSGATITYLLRARHVRGPIRLEVLDASGALVDTLTATKRRGINRVSWSMRARPPRVPRAAQVAFGASQGPRVLPGTYTVRLTRGKEVLEAKVTVGLDRRAPYGVAERKEQFEAAMRVHALFGRMTDLVGRIDAARASLAAKAAPLPAADPAKRAFEEKAARLEEAKKKIVATKEGGAITGEERLREHADILYGAILSWEGRPTRSQVERIDVLTRELDDVARDVDALLPPDGGPPAKGTRQRS